MLIVLLHDYNQKDPYKHPKMFIWVLLVIDSDVLVRVLFQRQIQEVCESV